MFGATQYLKKNILASIEAKRILLNDIGQQHLFNQMVDEVVQCYNRGGRLYIAGNGGSAADAQHLAAEFISKLAKERSPLPAEALTVNPSILTAISNDYGFEHVFSRQIRGKMTKADVFLAITTSGNSLNIMKALDICQEMGICSIVFSGRNGGKVKEKSDYCLIAPGETTSTIQEIHILLAHTLCECVEIALFREEIKELESVI